MHNPPRGFANQIPFGVPNQIGAFTPQNAEGLGVPWGRAMFNITRTASSDPVENIIRDIQNPLGGTNVNVNFGGTGGASPLKQRLTGDFGGQGGSPFGTKRQSLPGFAQSLGNLFPQGTYENQAVGPQQTPSYVGDSFDNSQGLGMLNQRVEPYSNSSMLGPFALRQRMLAQPLLPSVFI